MSDFANVLFGVLAGGFITFIVQVLIEKQKLMLDQKARLSRLHVDVRAAIRAIDTILSAGEMRRCKHPLEAHTRPSWDASYEVPASLTQLQQFSERLRPDSDWFPLLSDDSRDRLLSVPLVVGTIRYRVETIDSQRQAAPSLPPGRSPSILAQLRAITRDSDANDKIDSLLASELAPLQELLHRVARDVGHECELRDTWYTRPPAV